MRNSTLLFCILIPACVFGQARPNCEIPTGAWVNEHGSVLIVSSYEAALGKIEGHYRSESGTDGLQYPMTGWVNSKLIEEGKNNASTISFSVRWGDIGSLTAWTGTCKVVDGVPIITTIWNLARPNTDYDWDHILTNSATFVPVTVPKK